MVLEELKEAGPGAPSLLIGSPRPAPASELPGPLQTKPQALLSVLTFPCRDFQIFTISVLELQWGHRQGQACNFTGNWIAERSRDHPSDISQLELRPPGLNAKGRRLGCDQGKAASQLCTICRAPDGRGRFN